MKVATGQTNYMVKRKMSQNPSRANLRQHTDGTDPAISRNPSIKNAKQSSLDHFNQMKQSQSQGNSQLPLGYHA